VQPNCNWRINEFSWCAYFITAAIMRPTTLLFVYSSFVCIKLLSYLCKLAASVTELCSLPSHDSDKSNGLSRTLRERGRVAEENDADNGFSVCGDLDVGCCGDAKGDGVSIFVVIGNMMLVDEVVVGSLRRVDSRLMNDVLCLKRWHDDVLPINQSINQCIFTCRFL